MKIVTGDWKTGADVTLAYGWGTAKHLIFPDWSGKAEIIQFNQLAALEFSGTEGLPPFSKNARFDQLIKFILTDNRSAVVAMTNRQLDEVVKWTQVRPSSPQAKATSKPKPASARQAVPAASSSVLVEAPKPKWGWGFKTIVGGLVFLIAIILLGNCAPKQPKDSASPINPAAPAAPKEAKGDKYGNETQQQLWIAHSQDGIKNRLKDPSSAEFRNVFFSASSGKPMVCGEVNSKNGFGGYSGYQRFVAAGDSLAFLESDVKDFRVLWNKVCKQ